MDSGLADPATIRQRINVRSVKGGHEGLIEALATEGLTPADIDTVILTHLHFDHADNLDLFPLACDVVIASDKASFLQAFAKVGLVPDLGGLFFLVRAVGVHKAKELCFTARKIDAAEALALGLVNKVVPHDELIAEARAMAVQIANGSPTAMALTKRLLNMAQSATIEQMLEFEGYAQTVAYLTPEYREGVMAFREKRAPDFAGAAAAAAAAAKG